MLVLNKNQHLVEQLWLDDFRGEAAVFSRAVNFEHLSHHPDGEITGSKLNQG